MVSKEWSYKPFMPFVPFVVKKICVNLCQSVSHKTFSDTPKKIEEFQIFLLRNASVARRLSKVRSLSQTTIQLSRRAIARANPELTGDVLKCRIVEYFYGKSLAEKIQEYLARRNK